MEKEDLAEYNKLKTKYNHRTIAITGVSLINIVVIASMSKNFLKYGMWKKFLIGTTVFFASHYSGMYDVKKEADELNDKLINKYQHIIKNIPEKTIK